MPMKHFTLDLGSVANEFSDDSMLFCPQDARSSGGGSALGSGQHVPPPLFPSSLRRAGGGTRVVLVRN